MKKREKSEASDFGWKTWHAAHEKIEINAIQKFMFFEIHSIFTSCTPVVKWMVEVEYFGSSRKGDVDSSSLHNFTVEWGCHPLKFQLHFNAKQLRERSTVKNYESTIRINAFYIIRGAL